MGQTSPPHAVKLREVAERKGMDEEEITAVRGTREVVKVIKLFLSTAGEEVQTYGSKRHNFLSYY